MVDGAGKDEAAKGGEQPAHTVRGEGVRSTTRSVSHTQCTMIAGTAVAEPFSSRPSEE